MGLPSAGRLIVDAIAGSRPKSRHQLTFAILTVGILGFSLLQSLVIAVLPTIQMALGTSQANVTWVSTVYLLAASVFTPLLGRLGDLTGKKRIFVLCLCGPAIGSLLAGLATSLPLMLVARVIQATGGGLVPLAFGIIRDEFPPERVSKAIGTLASMLPIGTGVGVVVAGPIVKALDYHWLFWTPLFLLVPSAIIAHRALDGSSSTTTGRINIAAAALMSAALVLLLIAVSEAPRWGWSSRRVLVLTMLAVLVAASWIRVEWRSVNPLIDMRLMRVRAVWTCNLTALLLGVGMYSVFAFLPQFLQTPRSTGYGFGASVLSSGLMFLPVTICMFALGIGAGHLAGRFGSKNLLAAGAVLAVPGYFMFAFVHSQSWQIYLGSSLLGGGIGAAASALSSLVVESVPIGQTGVASGMNANVRTVGGAFGSALMASIVTSSTTVGGFPRESGYVHGFAMLAIVGVVCVGVTLLIPAGQSRRRSDSVPGRGTKRAGPIATRT